MTSAEARPGHVAERLPLDAGLDHLGDRAGDRHRRRQDHVVGGEIDHQEDDGGEEVGAEPANTSFIVVLS